LQEQLSAAQHKTTKLTAARDKLEIILHDLEAASAEEREQMEHQLAAANKALRSSSQQLTSVQQQLKQAQQAIADHEQQLGTAQQQLEAAQQELAKKEQQLGAAQQQLEAALQQLQAAQQQLTQLPELSQHSGAQQAEVGSVPPPSYEAATNAAAVKAASATQVGTRHG
jgi:chromosome segregation ATPase